MVDTVYLGAFRKADIERLGGYRELPGVAEDADLYFRWGKQGASVLLDPAIRSSYRPRDRWPALARQYYRYGWGKADMLYANRVLPSLRPLAPLALLLGLAVAGATAAMSRLRWPLYVILGAWGLVLAWVAVGAGGGIGHRFRTLLATATMQLSYGGGLALGVLRGPGPRRHLRPQS